MAYSDVYRSPSQSSSYSVSAIDGIEIKISEKLIPPPAVQRPVEYDTGNPSEILFMEYDFGLEERVLEWSRSQRENDEALQQAATERVGNQIQQFSQMPEPQPPPPPPSSQQAPVESQTPQTLPSGSHSSGPSTSNPTTAWNAQAEIHTQAGPGLNPFMNIGSSILTPMPIIQGHVRKESGGNKNQAGMIDLKDFENEQDPFENMELKVLNDKEELNKMILGVQAVPEGSGPVENGGSSQSQDAASRSPTSSPINLQDVDYPEVESYDSGKFDIQQGQQQHEAGKYPSNQAQGSVTLQTGTPQVYYQSPQSISTLPYTSQNLPSTTYSYNQGTPLPPIPNARYYPQQPVSNTVQNFVSPNKTNAGGFDPTGAPNHNNVTFTSAGATYNNQLGERTFIPFQSFYNRNPFLDNQNGNIVTNGQGSSQSSAVQGRETPPLNPLRNARSTPDISGSEDRRLPPLMPSSHTPPPITRSISPSEISQTTSQSPTRKKKVTSGEEDSTWEHYSVLPPSPRSAGSTRDSYSPAASSARKPSLPNPFDSLSPEARRLVESITDMGFPKARVARVVEKKGIDDKQVVDLLCLINRLAEKGYAAEDAETALAISEGSIEKAEQYLKLLAQFKELGFTEKNIQDALVSTNLDENRTLDLLTAS